MRSSRSLALAVAASFALAVGCSDSSSNPDSGVKQDGKATVDGTNPTTDGSQTTLTCKPDKSDCKDFVISKLKLPATEAEIKAYGLVFDSQSYNALGAILGAIGGMMANIDMQGSVDAAVWSGKALLLMRLQAADFSTSASAMGQAWVGVEQKCCTGLELDAAKCKVESEKTCMAGESNPFTFDVNTDYPQNAVMSGSISSGSMSFTAAKLDLVLPLSSLLKNPLTLSLESVQVKGKLSGSTITDGTLAGAISKSDLDTKVIPAIGEMLRGLLADANTAQSIKDQILTVFDTNKDQSVTDEEVAKNALLQTFLAGDVDMDKDGTKDHLSVGLGFEAIKAVINK